LHLQDNCAQDAQVKLTVLSNEFEFSNTKTAKQMVMIEERRRSGSESQSHAVGIYVEAFA
jgi:hypothetical protein